MTAEFINRIKRICRTENDFPLAEKSSFKTGGRALLAAFPDSESEISEIIYSAETCGMKYTVLGNMTNVLVPDEGYDGLVIFTSLLRKTDINEDVIVAECGASLTALSATAGSLSLSGLEFAYGIPGTVGGAVYMNAGAYGGCMADVIRSVRVIAPDEEKIIDYKNDRCSFGYRDSRFRHSGEIIVSVTLGLGRGDKEAIRDKMNGFMQARMEKQPLDRPSAGSTFKRPAGYFAGALIESAGLRGYRLGGAGVSDKHAGFIVNNGGATSREIEELIKFVKNKVYETSGVMLDEEIIYLR